jgi:hypothetical protein
VLFPFSRARVEAECVFVSLQCHLNNSPGYTQGGSHGLPIMADFAVKYHNEAQALGMDVNAFVAFVSTYLHLDADVPWCGILVAEVVVACCRRKLEFPGGQGWVKGWSGCAPCGVEV